MKAPPDLELFAKIRKNMEQNKSKRGGRREGAGRKATGRTKKTVTLTLSADAVAILDRYVGRKSEYIERLILDDNASKM